MTRRVFNKIAEGLHEAIAIAKGEADPSTYRVHVPAEIDVRAIRRHVGMTQAQFAARFGFPITCVRDWEQGRSRPDSAVRAYLLVIDRKPEAVEAALRATSAGRSLSSYSHASASTRRNRRMVRA